MALADALHTITVTAADIASKTRLDFTKNDWAGNPNRAATFSGLVYFTKLVVLTDATPLTGGLPIFVEGYRDSLDETTFLFSRQVWQDYDDVATWDYPKNEYDFFQPVRATSVDILFRVGDPYPVGSRIAMGSVTDNFLVMLHHYPSQTV